jgi:hypothetical protein
MANIQLKDLTVNSSLGSFIQDLFSCELALKGGGFFKFRKPKPPVVDVNPPSVVPDILIGFAPFSIF